MGAHHNEASRVQEGNTIRALNLEEPRDGEVREIEVFDGKGNSKIYKVSEEEQ